MYPYTYGLRTHVYTELGRSTRNMFAYFFLFFFSLFSSEFHFRNNALICLSSNVQKPSTNENGGERWRRETRSSSSRVGVNYYIIYMVWPGTKYNRVEKRGILRAFGYCALGNRCVYNI